MSKKLFSNESLERQKQVRVPKAFLDAMFNRFYCEPNIHGLILNDYENECRLIIFKKIDKLNNGFYVCPFCLSVVDTLVSIIIFRNFSLMICEKCQQKIRRDKECH